VCPHLLTVRPLVVRGDAHLHLKVIDGTEPTYLTVDGQDSRPLEEGDELRCCRSADKVTLLRVGSGSFYDVLRTKLKWGER
jgi:NAD+ kinase